MEPVKQVEFEREYEASKEAIWKAWTDPEQLKLWWGPNDVTIPECTLDLKVGGELYIVMEAGEAMGEYKGTRWPMKGKFTLVETNSKLAYSVQAWTEGHEETTQIDQDAELTLTEDAGKTKMLLKVTVKKIGPDAGMAIEGMQYGFNQQFDKLQQYLKNLG
jgi:uncharacterized protein YndB with AHSA1/START domain